MKNRSLVLLAALIVLNAGCYTRRVETKEVVVPEQQTIIHERDGEPEVVEHKRTTVIERHYQ